ncbi:MAG: M36 family metallopeptidase [Ferruginibacter sp.]
MRKILLFIFTLCTFYISKAQTGDADKIAALQLVSANRAAIGLSADDLNNLAVSSSYVDRNSGIRYVYLIQTYLDIPVYNQMQVLTFRNDKLLSKAGGRITAIDQKANVPDGVPPVSAANALVAAIADRNLNSNQTPVIISTKDNGRKIEFNNMGVSRENITAQLMWVPATQGKAVNLTWQIYIIPNTSSDYWLVKIDANNSSSLGVDNLTVYCSWDDPNQIYQFGSHYNRTNEIAGSSFGSNNLFEFKKVVKDIYQSSVSPSLADNSNYRVIPLPYEAPSFMPGASTTWHAIRTNPWTAGSANATTLKWHSTDAVGTDYNYTRGNNVWAYQDRTSNNTGTIAKSASSTTILPNLTFDFTPDYTQEPTVTTPPPNQQFNITNLFYWNNIIHDVLYNYGFDEVGGNFQTNNLGRGGAGNDHVLAEAQDGSGTDNANFSTPADGSSGRMQMYLWVTPTPDRDGDVDNGIIAHEYGHGVSNRLTGGPANASCLGNNEQMGEGWSDYQALMFTQDWSTATLSTGFNSPRGIGTYALNQPTSGLGIRPAKYSTDLAVNNYTYTNLPSMAIPHGVGFVWCTVLWDMTWNIINQVGTINPNIYDAAGGGGNNIAWKLVMEGMRLQPCSPGFIDGRNAILQADLNLYGGAYQCAIKEAFRRRGMGDGASQGSSNSISDQVTSFVLNPSVALTVGGVTQVPEAQNISYTKTVSTLCTTALTNYILTDTLPTNVSFVSATNGGTYNSGNRVVSWVVNQSANTTVNYNFVVKINSGAYYVPVNYINETVAGATIPASWTTTATPTSNLWTVSAVQSHSAPNSFFTSNLITVNDQLLATTNSMTLPASPLKLTFWGYINSESGWDGGVVEISTNGGTNWSDLGTYITSGKYNGTLGTSSNPLSGRSAFTGNSAGFVQTTINLASYAGLSNIKFRFRFGSDASVNAVGWYVDDILLQDVAHVDMRSSLFNASSVRINFSDTTTIILPPLPLPVLLTSFTATAKEKGKAYLEWFTSSENNNKGFQVERAVDVANGNYTWKNIGFVKGTINSNTTTRYSYDDEPTGGKRFVYRLKQIDFDENFKYSDTRLVVFKDLAYELYACYPNPVSDVVNIKYRIPENNFVQLGIFDHAGKLIKRLVSENKEEGIYQVSFATGNLPSGAYFYKLESGSFSETKRFTIAR